MAGNFIHTIPIPPIKFMFEGNTEKGIVAFLLAALAAGTLGNFLCLSNKLFALFGQFGDALAVQRPIKIFFSFNPGLQTNRFGIERRFGPNREIGVFARLE